MPVVANAQTLTVPATSLVNSQAGMAALGANHKYASLQAVPAHAVIIALSPPSSSFLSPVSSFCSS